MTTVHSTWRQAGGALRSTRRSALASALTLAVLTTAFAGPALALPFEPVLDEFWIVKNGTEIFRDTFEDGVPPPSGPDGDATYALRGEAGMTSESAGTLTMTPSLGDTPIVTSGPAQLATSANRIASLNPSNPNFLGLPAGFSVHGLFDLTSLPELVGQAFGVRLADSAPALDNPGNDVIQLGVSRNPDTGELGVGLLELDRGLNTFDAVSFLSLESLIDSATQIELIIAKAPGTDAINAAYRLYAAGGSILDAKALSTFSVAQGDVLRIYNGENYTRAEFFALDASPVPLPSSLALVALGFALVATGRRRGRAS